LHFVNSLSAALGRFLAHYGGLGLFALSFLDASVLGLPLINDLLLIHLSARHAGRTVLYVFESTAGSMLGSYLLYYFARAGRRALGSRSSRKAEAVTADDTAAAPRRKPSRVQQWIERNDFAAIVVGSLLPPPAPFKAFPVAAGVIRMDAARFILALLVGRGLRFGIEGWVGALYGVAAESYLTQHFALVSWLSVVILVVVMVAYRLLADRPSR
jgi:membrane protein YqaA with SNARE-associated domain